MKVSIVTITFYRADMRDTIQSTLNQIYQYFEHIIINDGSTDRTQEMVKKIQRCKNQVL